VYLLDPDPLAREGILDNLVRRTRMYSFEEGECICIQGESSDNVFIIYSGTVKIRYMPNGRERKVGTVVRLGAKERAKRRGGGGGGGQTPRGGGPEGGGGGGG